jgi:DNA (cytosine-5)-methyltransferase 1
MVDFSVTDIFCGAGGFSEGFRQAGYKIIAGIDNWKPAIETFNYNFGLDCSPCNVLDFETSTTNIDDLADTDVIVGSPPCVSFSSSNRSGKADKSLGLKLTKIFLRIVAFKKFKPNSKLKAWFMENVTNSRIHLPNNYSFQDLGLGEWALKIGYEPNMIAINLEDNRLVINAADYGVPQTRERVFTGEIIGLNKQILPPKTHQEPGGNGELPDYLTLGFVRKSLPNPSSIMSESIICDPLYPNIKINQNKIYDQFYDTGLYALDWEGSRFLKTNHPYMGKMSFPEREDKPSRTVTATKIGNSREALIYKSERDRIGDGEYRTPTVREAATLMGFPLTYQFLGSENGKWRLVGNAVCPPVSRAFACMVLRKNNITSEVFNSETTRVGSSKELINLNTYAEKSYINPPIRKKGSRFRRHPIKNGNLTVTLSNYDIERNDKNTGNWKSSIQYGTGSGFPIQTFPDGYYKILEPIILGFKDGQRFIEIINNGFSEKISDGKTLQDMYEAQKSIGKYLDPKELIDTLGFLLEGFDLKEPDFSQEDNALFTKNSIPKKQVMALYAINKICSIANGGNK